MWGAYTANAALVSRPPPGEGLMGSGHLNGKSKSQPHSCALDLPCVCYWSPMAGHQWHSVSQMKWEIAFLQLYWRDVISSEAGGGGGCNGMGKGWEWTGLALVSGLASWTWISPQLHEKFSNSFDFCGRIGIPEWAEARSTPSHPPKRWCGQRSPLRPSLLSHLPPLPLHTTHPPTLPPPSLRVQCRGHFKACSCVSALSLEIKS